MRLTSFVAASVLMMAAAGCGRGIKVASDYDRQANLEKYGTFFVVKGNSSGDSLIDSQISTDVSKTLMGKGWAEVPEGDGQAVVIVHTATPAEHTYASFYNGWGGWRWESIDSPAKFPEDYKVGTVVVTIFDADTKKSIWRGYAVDAISNHPQQPAKVREHAVSTMFAKFPPSY